MNFNSLIARAKARNQRMINKLCRYHDNAYHFDYSTLIFFCFSLFHENALQQNGNIWTIIVAGSFIAIKIFVIQIIGRMHMLTLDAVTVGVIWT